MTLEVLFPFELCDHCQKGSAIVAIIWKPLCSETDLSSISTIVAICANLVGDLVRLAQFSLAIVTDTWKGAFKVPLWQKINYDFSLDIKTMLTKH